MPDRVPHGGFQQLVFQGLAEALVNGLDSEFLGINTRFSIHQRRTGAVRQQSQGGLHHPGRVPSLEQEAVRSADSRPEAAEAFRLPRQQDHRQVPGRGIILEQSAELVAVQDGHDPVQHHHIRWIRGEHQQGFRAVGGLHHAVPAMLEQGLDQVPLGKTIVRHEHREYRQAGIGFGGTHSVTLEFNINIAKVKM